MNRKQTWLILTLTVNQILKYHTYSIHNTLFYYISTMIASIGLFFLQWRRCRKLMQGLDVDCEDKVNGPFTWVLIMCLTVFHIICTISCCSLITITEISVCNQCNKEFRNCIIPNMRAVSAIERHVNNKSYKPKVVLSN